MTGFLVAAMLVYLIERLRPLAVRWLAIREQAAKGLPGKSVVIPPDLRMLCDQQSEKWARDDMEKRLLELYNDGGGNWDRVRSAMTGAE